MPVRLTLIAVLSGLLQAQVAADPDQIVTGSIACPERNPAIAYGPVRRFDGIMFSFVDGILFTPCGEGARCDSDTDGDTLDLEWRQGDPLLEQVWNGWGYYRITFEGRHARRETAGSCDLGSAEYYEVNRVLSAEKLPDR